jgi:hypothetical protein
MHALRRASTALFYLLGSLTIMAIVLVQRDVFVMYASRFLAVVDLPLLLVGMLYGGSALCESAASGRSRTILATIVFTVITLLFVLFCYLNFALPFSDI